MQNTSSSINIVCVCVCVSVCVCVYVCDSCLADRPGANTEQKHTGANILAQTLRILVQTRAGTHWRKRPGANILAQTLKTLAQTLSKNTLAQTSWHKH